MNMFRIFNLVLYSIKHNYTYTQLIIKIQNIDHENKSDKFLEE